MRASRVREILIRAIYTGRLMGDPVLPPRPDPVLPPQRAAVFTLKRKREMRDMGGSS